MNINWFPGHMKKATDQIKEKLKLVDLCCEVIDARIPYSSRNMMVEEVTQAKPLLIIINKSDMADLNETKKWLRHFEEQGKKAIPFNAQQDNKSKIVYQAAEELIADKLENRRSKGIEKEEIRMMVFGIPNSGKSTFINNLSNRRSAKVGNRPGVTTAQQWIKTNEKLLLMDTPGILWNKFTGKQALHLAYTGAIRDEVLEIQEIGFSFIKDMLKTNEDKLVNRYEIEKGLEAIQAMDQIAENRGAITKGGEIDYHRAAQIVLDDFRKLRLGPLTLERVEDNDGKR